MLLLSALTPDVSVSVNAILSEGSYAMGGGNTYLVAAGNEFGLNCTTQPHFSVAWFFGDPPVRGWSVLIYTSLFVVKKCYPTN